MKVVRTFIKIVTLVILLVACEATFVFVKGNRHNISTSESEEFDSISVPILGRSTIDTDIKNKDKITVTQDTVHKQY